MDAPPRIEECCGIKTTAPRCTICYRDIYCFVCDKRPECCYHCTVCDTAIICSECHDESTGLWCRGCSEYICRKCIPTRLHTQCPECNNVACKQCDYWGRKVAVALRRMERGMCKPCRARLMVF